MFEDSQITDRSNFENTALVLIPLICIHVMRGLVPRIHVFRGTAKTWMAGTSPAMTACDSN